MHHAYFIELYEFFLSLEIINAALIKGHNAPYFSQL